MKREAPGEIRVGEEFTYRVRLHNRSDETLEGVVLRENAPPGFELLDVQLRSDSDDADDQARRAEQTGRPVEAAAPREPSTAAGRSHALRFDIGLLAPDAEAVIEIRGIAHREGEAQTCTIVNYDAPVCTTWNVVDVELRAALEVEEGPHWVCDEIPVRYAVANRGSGTVESGRMFLDLPDGLTNEDGDSRVAVEFDTLGSGESEDGELQLRATRGGNFDLIAHAETDTLTVRSEARRFSVLAPELDLAIAEPGRLPVGATRRIAVRARNTGQAPVQDFVLSVTGLENADAGLMTDEDGFSNEVAVGTLAPGETREFVLAVKPDELGELTVRVRAEAHCLRGDRAVERALSARAIGLPAVRLAVIDTVDPLPVGELTTYRIEVKNQGTAEDLGVVIAVEIPPQLEFVRAEGVGEATMAEDGTVRLGPIERLDPGQSVAWQLVARGIQAGDARLRVRLFSDATDGPVLSEEATNVVR